MKIFPPAAYMTNKPWPKGHLFMGKPITTKQIRDKFTCGEYVPSVRELEWLNKSLDDEWLPPIFVECRYDYQ